MAGGNDSLANNDASVLANWDDDALAMELANGNHEALIVLFRRHRGAVLDVARRIVRDYGEAEEVVQQVFIEAYGSIAKFNSERGPFRSWLLRRATSRAINRKDKLRRVQFYAQQTLDHEVELSLYRKKEKNLVMFEQESSCFAKELLTKLPTRERRIVIATFLEGMSLQQITETMRLSLPTVRRRLYEGLRRLRSMIKKTKNKSIKRQE